MENPIKYFNVESFGNTYHIYADQTVAPCMCKKRLTSQRCRFFGFFTQST